VILILAEGLIPSARNVDLIFSYQLNLVNSAKQTEQQSKPSEARCMGGGFRRWLLAGVRVEYLLVSAPTQKIFDPRCVELEILKIGIS